MVRRTNIIILAVLVLLGLGQTSHAALTAVDPGPYTAATGYFPLWYTDTSGTTLDLCLSKAVSSRPAAGGGLMCTLLPNPGVFDDTQPTVFPFNWPDESFYFTGDATIDDTAPGGTGVNLLYVSTLESAFGTGLPAPNDQITFTRIRIRVDVPVAGTYTVTHPYGQEVFDVTTPGTRAINMTRDIGIGAPGVFTGALAGDVGPFLQSVNGPYTEPNPDTGLIDSFVGDPNILEPVTGSPLGTNFVHIVGPGIDLQTDLFAVSGRIWSGAVPTALDMDRSTYTRSVDGTVIDIFATSSPTAVVTYRETLAAGTELPTTPDGTGNFYGRDPAPATLPPYVVVTATDGTVTTPTPLASPVVDVVKIGQALYLKNTQTLILEATSSDTIQVPTLTAVGFGSFVPGALATDLQTLQISPVAEPPATVTVKSSAGGSDTEPVIVSANTPPVVSAPAPITVSAPLCATSVPATDPAIAAFLTAATAIDNEDGDVTASITTDAPVDFPLGTTTVTFTATDSAGLTGTATSTITVTETPNTAPVVTAPAPISVIVPAGATSAPATDPAIAAFLTGATAADTEDGDVTASITSDAPADFPLGTTVVTFTATDACGLTASATSSVTVQQPVNNPPVVTAPAPISVTAPICAVSAPATGPAIAAFLAGATATDLEDGDLTASITNDAPADFPLGATSVTFAVTDSGGLPGSAASTVTVVETPNSAPVFTAVPAPITVTVPAGATSAPATDPAIVAFLAGATATDAEDGALTVANDAPANFPLGTTTVTFSATDLCGLTTTVNSTVTVQQAGNTPPVITAPAPISVTAPICAVSAPATGPAIAAFLAGATATDLEDGDLTASITNDAPADFPLGATTVTFAVTDSGGLSGSAASTVTVVETPNSAPVFTAVPAPITVTVPAGATSAPATDPAIVAFLAGATATDAEDGPLAVANDAPANFPLGTTTVTFSATDLCGLTTTASSTVTVVQQAVIVDLNIASFRATRRIRVSRSQSVNIALGVRNVGTVDQPVPATVVGVQNGVEIYNQTLQVSDPVGGGRSTFTFPAYPISPVTPVADILWTVTVQDTNPSSATSTTRVRR